MNRVSEPRTGRTERVSRCVRAPPSLLQVYLSPGSHLISPLARRAAARRESVAVSHPPLFSLPHNPFSRCLLGGVPAGAARINQRLENFVVEVYRFPKSTILRMLKWGASAGSEEAKPLCSANSRDVIATNVDARGWFTRESGTAASSLQRADLLHRKNPVWPQ
jgi:hypothetical protein